MAPGSLAGLQKDIQFTADIYPLGIARYMLHVRSTDEFFSDAAAGTLPAFSIVDPDFSAYSEENPQDIHKGESFAAAVGLVSTHRAPWSRAFVTFAAACAAAMTMTAERAERTWSRRLSPL